MKALAQEAGWEFHEFGPEPYEIFNYNLTLRGIRINVHPECETLRLIFDEDRGWLVSLPGLNLTASDGFIVEKEDELGTYVTMEMPPPEELARLTWNDLANMGTISTAWTKTQFAGAETHILLCKLLRYLEKKYFLEITPFGLQSFHLHQHPQPISCRNQLLRAHLPKPFRQQRRIRTVHRRYVHLKFSFTNN